MSKRNNISYVKPEEPNFLKRIKQEIGYKEPDTIEAKRAEMENFSDDEDEEYQEREDEKPQVVQLRDGDLTEEEAARLAKEEAEKPADLSQKIVFKVKKKEKSEAAPDGDVTVGPSPKPVDKPLDIPDKPGKSKRKSQKPAKSLLSFDDDEDDE